MSDTGTPATPPPGAPKEPLLAVGSITTVVTAGIALLVAYGLHISDGQQAAILGFIAAAAPLVVAFWGRLKVWSPATVRAALLAAGPREPRRMPYASPGGSTGGNPVAPLDGP
ncbi:hypothetical protein [Dactylosporangium sp. CA-139066]|uniref:hypothetical protein n=1 Tax=Dactylosporangium sp. CA-139066 TaxID=3239930 RepID=UPI003D8F5974